MPHSVVRALQSCANAATHKKYKHQKQHMVNNITALYLW